MIKLTILLKITNIFFDLLKLAKRQAFFDTNICSTAKMSLICH
ncbi:hypothetical protein HMPREF0381_2222 [Lachnoanaerobaculum saburreum DSM 3986]|uniref:Uncharacterized protein n=1 Tax=Lachnoanaerobaculum saburreum DSM 3986 TaxID=887325 RepID=E6LQI7_9FIRM|nr:hypothetical protein HMPREF0381_2222 [Lachnoanaerobaculum saburreum DSM 3986]